MPGERRHHGARLETHINGKRPVERQTQRSQVRHPITFYHVIISNTNSSRNKRCYEYDNFECTV